ncbi:MAG: hypothetical protein ICCCNLDF_03538 [Planctomycetes bacterium]|nr:hypothetical protein [Planctomycetota bacterium]
MPETKCKVDCPCGWSEVFSRAYSGLLLECPRCGKSHRIPTFDAPDADAAIDMSTMKRLLDQPAEAPPVSVPFKPLLLLSCVFAVVVIAVSLPLLWNRWPANIAVAGGAAAWPVAIAVAWLGQARQLRAKKHGAPDKDSPGTS